MSNRMWGGRFASGPAEIMEEINASIGFDKRLAPQDIRGSLAHVAMLGQAGILPAEDVAAIEAGLKSVRDEIEAGTDRSDLSPKAVLTTLSAIEARFDTPVVFAATPTDAGE